MKKYTQQDVEDVASKINVMLNRLGTEFIVVIDNSYGALNINYATEAQAKKNTLTGRILGDLKPHDAMKFMWVVEKVLTFIVGLKPHNTTIDNRQKVFMLIDIDGNSMFCNMNDIERTYKNMRHLFNSDSSGIYFYYFWDNDKTKISRKDLREMMEKNHLNIEFLK